MHVWKEKRFDALSSYELFSILKLRQDIFIIEQACIYPDIDDLDPKSRHIFATNSEGEVYAYVRLVPPQFKYSEPSIGRVVVREPERKGGTGKALMQYALGVNERQYPGQGNKIGAQAHLKAFYGALGYEQVSEVYDEDGIDHIDMLRAPGSV